ncbi:hypothetical protein LA080_005367 [Diaporthe eres]|uniref:Uncharacterized protein n=1 Tax=Diaporthe vaccinii TaxID=105482 RepID=A0ABR4EA39_9PEZI|nr:hypothetical protein LA080_005367 [Diaporthe eres]
MVRMMVTIPKSARSKKVAAATAAARAKAEEAQPRVPQNGISKTKGPKSKPPPKRAVYQLRSKLIKRLDGQDQEELEQQQSRLLRRASIALAEDGLELPVVLDAAAVMMPEPDKPRPAHNKWRDGRRGRFAKRYIDAEEFLDPDENDELGLSDRHIPQIGARRRVSKKPAKVPFSIWMAYKQLDDFVYRHSLSDEEVAALPTDDEAFDFQGGGGEKPSLPVGFAWSETKRLVDRRQWADN